MKALLFPLLAFLALAISASTNAQDKFSYEADGFYIKANTRADIRIGVTGDQKIAHDDGEFKAEVEFFRKDVVTEGYSAMRKEICDPDFIISDSEKEMMVEDDGEGREILRALIWNESDVIVTFSLQDGSTPNGKGVSFVLPNDQRRAMVQALTNR